jgi:BsuBI/PstI restriction endonuclease domain
VPSAFQGVTKAKIQRVLAGLDLGDRTDLIDAVFALLDNKTESWFSTAPQSARFCDGCSTAHLACHVGILQRGSGKIDREGRDYWIKPLRELGGIEAITLHDGEFISGHVKAKSPHSCYRLEEGFKAILKAPEARWKQMLVNWAGREAARTRRVFQAQAAEAARRLVDTGHSDLIRASIRIYAGRFLPGYQVIYVDDGDGDRITDKDRVRLAQAGIQLRLDDAMPDVLLWNPTTDCLWVIEAVTSDGEVDIHKVNQLKRLARRSRKAGIQFTTTYNTWRELAARQGAHSNIAVDTFIWIQADPAKHLRVESFV